jgi:hypothetical protein
MPYPCAYLVLQALILLTVLAFWPGYLVGILITVSGLRDRPATPVPAS